MGERPKCAVLRSSTAPAGQGMLRSTRGQWERRAVGRHDLQLFGADGVFAQGCRELGRKKREHRNDCHNQQYEADIVGDPGKGGACGTTGRRRQTSGRCKERAAALHCARIQRPLCAAVRQMPLVSGLE